MKSFQAGNFSEARFKYDVASDYGVSSSTHNSVWLYEKAFQKSNKESKPNACSPIKCSLVAEAAKGEVLASLRIVANYLKQASKNKIMRATGGFIGSHRTSAERIHRGGEEASARSIGDDERTNVGALEIRRRDVRVLRRGAPRFGEIGVR